MTNIESAASATAMLYKETDGAAFQNSTVGQFFIGACSDLIIFNKFNKGRTLIDYKSLSDFIIDEFIVNDYCIGNVPGGRSFVPPFAESCTTFCGAIYHYH